MRTAVVTIYDPRRAHRMTGTCPGRVREMTDRFIRERLCRSDELTARDNKKPHAGAETDHAWAIRTE